MYQPRVFIADDHPLVLEGFRQLLANDTIIVGTAHTGGELLEKAPKAAPDIVLLDVSLPDKNGFDLKQSASTELLTAIRTVMNHRSYISTEVATDVRESIEHPWVRPEGFNVSLT